MARVIIKFPDWPSAEAFVAWLCNCGEQNFFQCEEMHAEEEERVPIKRFKYDGVEITAYRRESK